MSFNFCLNAQTAHAHGSGTGLTIEHVHSRVGIFVKMCDRGCCDSDTNDQEGRKYES